MKLRIVTCSNVHINFQRSIFIIFTVENDVSCLVEAVQQNLQTPGCSLELWAV